VARSTLFALPLVEVLRHPAADDGGDRVIFQTVRGGISARLHPVPGGSSEQAVVWLPGAERVADPAVEAFFMEGARELVGRGIESVRLAYRRPNRLDECVRDALVVAEWLSSERGIERIVLVGHGFGGAVAVTAGVASPVVSAVAALAAESAGTETVDQLDKPLFLAHGDADPVVPVACTNRLAQRAAGEVTCRVYPGGHDLAAARPRVLADLAAWLGAAV
jgi:dienelactone hydrolase